MAFLKKFVKDENKRFLKRSLAIVEEINGLESKFNNLSQDDLKKRTEKFKKDIKEGKSLDEVLPEAFAVVREVSKRTLGQRHYDVQLIGGIAIHQGRIAEMKTGEGKTLAATLPVYLNALSGKGVHVVTVNDYLSRRDTVWMGQIYHALGLTVSCLNHDTAYIYDSEYTSKEDDAERDDLGSFKVVHDFLRPVSRSEAYRADITYGTNNEFGFDYLRDNLVSSSEQLSQRNEREGGWNFVIVDEIDSILIDEARTPLIISRPDVESGKLYEKFARVIPKLNKEEDYTVDEKMRAASLTQEGITKVEEMLGMKDLYQDAGIRFIHHLEQALKAETLFKRDKDYVVKDGEVIIVDAFTGRLMPGRRYSEGLHQAIEAKEGVKVQKESRTVATITFQNYFKLYKKLSGMTGTAITSQEEFFKVYGLEVAVIPTAKPLARKDYEDKIYGSEKGKYKAVVKEIKEIHESGQPVLVGTVSIEKNEYIGSLLSREGVPHKMLNAKNHEKEAEIIAQAGRVGAVTIATNMAGRGVDIVLGGNPFNEEDAEKVKELGGLFVIGTERHEARRIDNQLRGRAGRQGDEGESQFFVSLEDDLMRIFGGDKVKNLMARLNVPEDEPIQSSIVSKAIESAQSKVEGHHFDIRKHVLEYDEIINKHREYVYLMRRKIITSKDAQETKQRILEMIQNEIGQLIAAHTISDEEFEFEEMAKGFARIVPGDENFVKTLTKEAEKKKDAESLSVLFMNIVNKVYQEKENEFSEAIMRQVEKSVLLRVIDELWMDHLEYMDYIKTSIGLRAYGQRDPLVEYTRESHKRFQELQQSIQTQVSELIFRVGVMKTSPESQQPLQFQGPAKNMTGSGNSSSPQGMGGQKRKIGRNEIVKITDGKETKEIKYKKALPLLEGGEWRIV